VALYARDIGTALAARALFGHLPVPSLVGHGASHRPGLRSNGHRYPALTISGKGPPWSTPGHFAISTGINPRGTELARLLDQARA
jgi:hypothetical protein